MMKLFRKLKTFRAMPAEKRRLFAEALATSAYVRFTLSFLPFKKVSGWLGKVNVDNTAALTEQQQLVVKKIYHTLKLCDQYALWRTECYTLALTGKIMLRRRKIPSTLYIGFRKENEKFAGHAWLKTAIGIISGNGPDLSEYHVNAYFS